MTIGERLGRLTATELAPVVRHALPEEQAWALSCDVQSLGWAAMNPITLGLYRLTGLATVGSRIDVAWAVVLKVVGDVDLAGSPLDVGFVHGFADFNYWKREAVAFESGLLDSWPGPLVPVRCLGVDNAERGASWMWLESQGDAPAGGGWTLEQHAVLAYDLGAFAAQWVDHAPSATAYPWLAQRWLRSGLTGRLAGRSSIPHRARGPAGPRSRPSNVPGSSSSRSTMASSAAMPGAKGAGRGAGAVSRGGSAAAGGIILSDLAVEAMSGVYRRAPENRGFDSPTFCHGEVVPGLVELEVAVPRLMPSLR